MHAEAHHLLHTSLEQALGPQPAAVLMDVLAACATKDDLRELKHELVHEMDLRFAVVDERFRGLEQHFDERFRAVDVRFDEINGRLNAIDGRLNAIDGRLDSLVLAVHHELRAWNRTLFVEMAGLMVVLFIGAGLLQR